MKTKRGFTLLATVTLLVVSGFFAARQIKSRLVLGMSWRTLHDPQRLVVYSLSPKPANFEALDQNPDHPESALAGMDLFHGYRVLNRTEVTGSAEKRRASVAVESAAASLFVLANMCFAPRHGVRVTGDDHAYDFLICYECHRMVCYDGDEQIASTEIGGSSASLDALVNPAPFPANQVSDAR